MNRQTTSIVIVLCLLKLTLHLIADGNSGFQGDELLHIETGAHPAFGYMEFPPLIGWLAFIQNQFHSQSVFVHHIFSHLASLLILILIALTTVELGGKSKAVFIVLLCILIAPAFGRGHPLFQPVVFTHLFWLLSFYQLVRYVKTLDKKYLLYLTICAGFGVTLFRESFVLPKAFSYHGNFYLWAPEKGELPRAAIAFTNGEARIDFFQSFFHSVVAVKQIYNPYADFEKDLWQTIYVCRDAKLDFGQLRNEFKRRTFE